MAHRDHSKTIALSAYGQWLLTRYQPDLERVRQAWPEDPVWSNQAFMLERPDCSSAPTVDIAQAKLDEVSLDFGTTPWLLLKALAALVRFSFLADQPVASLRVHRLESDARDHRPLLQVTFEDRETFDLVLPADADAPLVLHEGPDPSLWFHPDRWFPSVSTDDLLSERFSNVIPWPRPLPRRPIPHLPPPSETALCASSDLVTPGRPTPAAPGRAS